MNIRNYRQEAIDIVNKVIFTVAVSPVFLFLLFI